MPPPVAAPQSPAASPSSSARPLRVVAVDPLQPAANRDIAALALPYAHPAQVRHVAEQRLRQPQRLVGLELPLAARHAERHDVIVRRQPQAVARRQLRVHHQIERLAVGQLHAFHEPLRACQHALVAVHVHHLRYPRARAVRPHQHSRAELHPLWRGAILSAGLIGYAHQRRQLRAPPRGTSLRSAPPRRGSPPALPSTGAARSHRPYRSDRRRY